VATCDPVPLASTPSPARAPDATARAPAERRRAPIEDDTNPGLLLGAYTYAELTACMVAWLPLLALLRVRHHADTVPRIEGRWLRRMARVSTRLSGLWRFEVEGDAPPDIASRAYVVVANHQSSADPFLLSFVPWDMRWVAKEELFRVPLTGWLLWLAGEIPVRRGDRESVAAMMAECRRTLDAGLSVMLFPEGTRSRDGALQPFKDGAFQLAIEAGVPVLPIVVDGTHACRPKGSLWFGRARARARVLAPVPTEGLGPGDVAALRERVREAIAGSVTRTG